MRSALVCLSLFVALSVQSQSMRRQIIPDVLKSFVESSNAYSFKKDSTKNVFACTGKLPPHTQVLRKLADTIAIVRIQDPKILASLLPQGKLMSVNDLWKFPSGFIMPTATDNDHLQQTWLIETIDTAIVKQWVASRDSVFVLPR